MKAEARRARALKEGSEEREEAGEEAVLLRPEGSSGDAKAQTQPHHHEEALFPAGPQRYTDAEVYTAEEQIWASPVAHAGPGFAPVQNHCKPGKARRKGPEGIASQRAGYPKGPPHAVGANATPEESFLSGQPQSWLLYTSPSPRDP